MENLQIQILQSLKKVWNCMSCKLQEPWFKLSASSNTISNPDLDHGLFL